MPKQMPVQGADLKQGVYKTDPRFMEAVNKSFALVWDLAADQDNTQCARYISEATDSLKVDWHLLPGADRYWLWLNPPFNNIAPWAKKCYEESSRGARILFLVPASVGSEWFAKYVEDQADCLWLRPRLTFDFTYPLDYKDPKKAGKPNKDPYPKDMMLCKFTRFNITPVCRSWRWDE